MSWGRKKPPCNGNCCVVFFPGGATAETVAVEKKALAEGNIEGTPEQLFVVDMLVPLTGKEAAERYLRLVPVEQRNVQHLTSFLDPEQEGRHFTCRHFDEETRKCREYANRPGMCSLYPYYRTTHRQCEHGCGCTHGRPTFRKRLTDWWAWLRDRLMQDVKMWRAVLMRAKRIERRLPPGRGLVGRRIPTERAV